MGSTLRLSDIPVSTCGVGGKWGRVSDRATYGGRAHCFDHDARAIFFSTVPCSTKRQTGSARRRGRVVMKVASGKEVEQESSSSDYAEGCAVRMGKVERVKPGSLLSLMTSNFDLELGVSSTGWATGSRG